MSTLNRALLDPIMTATHILKSQQVITAEAQERVIRLVPPRLAQRMPSDLARN